MDQEIQGFYGDFEHGVPRMTGSIAGTGGITVETWEERYPASFYRLRVLLLGLDRVIVVKAGAGPGMEELVADLATALADRSVTATPEGLRGDGFRPESGLGKRLRSAIAAGMLTVAEEEA